MFAWLGMVERGYQDLVNITTLFVDYSRYSIRKQLSWHEQHTLWVSISITTRIQNWPINNITFCATPACGIIINNVCINPRSDGDTIKDLTRNDGPASCLISSKKEPSAIHLSHFFKACALFDIVTITIRRFYNTTFLEQMIMGTLMDCFFFFSLNVKNYR